MMSVLSGCEAPQEKQQNKFLVIEQQSNGKYTVVEEMPTEGPSRAIIREKDANGNTTERFMNEDEMKALAAQEYQKVQDGTSETVQSGDSSAGMGLAGTILAVAAGSLLGNMIGNALMNNKNFSQRSSSVNKSAYSRSAASRASSSSSKKSFFGGSSTTSSTGSRSYAG
ncbi:lipoprotein [Sulfurimonas gotlandica GD1]|nr:lipoprotein [Sulfurimonas gotlandica GD1]